MLKNIPSILSPDLLKILMEMGHGDELVIADGNFPAASIARSFTFIYACPDNRTADLIVDGHIIVSDIRFPSTGSWSDWDFVTVYARADAGVSNVRLQSNSSAGLPNIDYIEVTGIFDLEMPAVPTGLNATAAILIGQIDLTRDAPIGATSYDVKRSDTDGGPYTPIATVEETSYSDSELPESTTYYYVVSAINSAGGSADSIQADATTQIWLRRLRRGYGD